MQSNYYGRGGRGGRGYQRGGGRYRFDPSYQGSSSRRADEAVEEGPVHNTELSRFLREVDGGNYAQLKDLTGRTFALDGSGEVRITFLHIQPDPFAPGSQVCVRLPTPFDDAAGLLLLGQPGESTRRVAAEDFLVRCFQRGLQRHHRSGAVQLARLSQHVLPRTAAVLELPPSSSSSVEAPQPGGRSDTNVALFFRVKLPGHGRRIDGAGISRILLHEILPAVRDFVCTVDLDALRTHVVSVHEQEWLRGQLAQHDLVAFVANDAVLPRVAGDSDRPLEGGVVVPFTSPSALEHQFTLPFTGRRLTGMGLPRGLTVIAGGGFHGKSTLLRALEVGVYNHVPDDGRAFVVVDPTAVKIRAEDRRSVAGVDLSPFINRLPFRKATTAFSTKDASGSTSQVANIMEALELGCSTLLLDEDTSATNFMYRDAMMEQLVPRPQEPITPFVERVRELISQLHTSVVMVVGGSGQYLPHADVVLVMNAYTVQDATARAKEIAAASAALLTPPVATPSELPPLQRPVQRHVLPTDTFSFARPRKGESDATKISGVGLERIRFADEDVDLGLVEQLVEEGQLNAIAQCLAMMFDGGDAAAEQAQQRWMVSASPAFPPPLVPSVQNPSWASGGVSDFARLIYNCERQLRFNKLETHSPSCYLPRGFTTLPRVFEIGAALNRLRPLCTVVKR